MSPAAFFSVWMDEPQDNAALTATEICHVVRNHAQQQATPSSAGG